MDYRNYKFTARELLWNLCLFAGLAAAVSYLFYRSVLAFALCFAGLPAFLRLRRETYRKRRQKEFLGQFLSGMQSVSTALSAGYSMESAFEQALKELRNMYDGSAMVIREFHYIIVQLHMNRSLEELLKGLAVRSGLEDVQNFADMFGAARRTGGNLIAIIRNTIQCITIKEETQREIDVCLSAKKLEQNIMSLVPFLILVYVQTVSPGFLDVMYQSAGGILMMSACLAVYILAWFWGRKIVTIEV